MTESRGWTWPKFFHINEAYFLILTEIHDTKVLSEQGSAYFLVDIRDILLSSLEIQLTFSTKQFVVFSLTLYYIRFY